ncbi:hypothetical protein [uncultured Corynebacterium sp.]|uniref:hypothetical protein n=1 Tax=uncultured Corynebacterium sp. TaxID=159447 RepID=UPI002598F482|nr:hypothetical protein [uncultured Corynebacterium sp.]
MPLIRISSAHLDTNDQPSTAIAAYVEATRAQSIALTGRDDFAVSTDHAVGTLRPNSQRRAELFALTERDGELRAQDDDTDLGFRGFLAVVYPLDSRTDTVEADVYPVADEALGELISSFATLAEDRTTLSLWAKLPFGEHMDEHPHAQALRAEGYELALVEQAAELGIGKLGTPAVPEGLRAEFFTGIMPPTDLIDSFLEIMAVADTDVPSAEPAPAREWTRQMLEEAAAHHARRSATILNVVLADAEGVVAFTTANVDPERPAALEQGLTVTHRRARGRGLATLVKQVLADEVAQRYPDIERVTTYNALDNAPMLAINNKLGLVPKFYETNWLKRI